LESLLDLRDGLAVVVCSKQNLPDLHDPGGAVLEMTLAGTEKPRATIVAVGDVAVAEAVASMVIAAQGGIAIRTIAVVDVTALDADRSSSAKALLGGEPAIGIASCAPRLLQGVLWEACGRIFPIHGYREQFGATPWETLQENRMDRFSLLEALLPSVSGGQTELPGLSLREAIKIPDGSIPFFEVPDISVRILRD
jgi:phosphoketolase